MEGEGAQRCSYVRLPEDCVSLCAENLGIQTSREVTSSLVEDVSFRVRQVVNVRYLHVFNTPMRHAATYVHACPVR